MQICDFIFLRTNHTQQFLDLLSVLQFSVQQWTHKLFFLMINVKFACNQVHSTCYRIASEASLY